MDEDQSTIAEEPSPRTRRWWRTVIYLAIISAFLLALWPIVEIGRRADDSEHKLHALICVAYIMQAFMESHGGNWPTSWAELEQTTIDRVPSMYQWPQHAGDVRERVEIDFNVSPDTLADPSFQVTSVIRPRGEYMYDPATRLESLQRYVDEQRLRQSPTQTSVSP